jgi:hypothetical protein
MSLAERYGFTPRFIFSSLPGFSAELTNNALAGVRCEAVVRFVEYNGMVSGNR